MMNSSARLLLALATLAVTAVGARGHVVPPESLHPVAEAYRRAAFVLNLDPVVWEQVAADADAIAGAWRGLDPAAAGTFETRIDRALRDEDRRLVFALMTRAVAEMGRATLALAGQDHGSREPARLTMREAQGILGAFDHVLAVADPKGFRHLGRQWLELSSALGSAGLLGKGEVNVDQRRFARATAEIDAYIAANYATFEPLAGRELAPWPSASPTYVPSAKLPPTLPPGHNINKQLPRPRQILNMATRGVDERATGLIALGDMGFDSPYVLGEPARSLGISCNTCHNKSITNPGFFVPGLSARPGGMDVSNSFFAPHANNGHFDPLDIPDLRGIRFTAPYGRNGRFDSLREFVRNAIVNEFNGPEPDPLLLDATVAYMFEFDFLPNPALKADGTLVDGVFAAARRGEAIFNRPFEQMADQSCATCHVPSANFLDHLSHDIGTVAGAEPYSRDRTLDTPTLLGITHTDPYFHDGSKPTLRAVNEWFNDSYGLGLSERELSDLTAYVQTVGDGIDAYEDTSITLEAELEEFSFFLSTYEMVLEKGKPELASTTFQTIALEIRAHKWDLQDWAHMPVLDRMADLMDDAYLANLAGDRERVDELVRKYRQTYETHKNNLI